MTSSGSPFNVALERQGADVHYVSSISTNDRGDVPAATLTRAGCTLPT